MQYYNLENLFLAGVQMKNCIRSIFALIEMLTGTALTAAAFGLVILPQGFAAGGVTGFSKIITGMIPVPLSVMVLAVNMVLLALGLIFVGRKFIAKTVAVSILFPAMLELFSRHSLESIRQDAMLCTIVAGVMLGIGSGLTLRSGASSGGSDIIGVILNKKFKIPVSVVMNVCDASVIILQALGQPLVQTIYGIMVITISAAIVGRVLTFGTGESQIVIFSEYHDEIRDALLNELDAGLTSLVAESGYRQKQMKVIVSVVPYQKVMSVKQMILGIDPAAFVVVDEIRSVLGRGYTIDRRSELPKSVQPLHEAR